MIKNFKTKSVTGLSLVLVMTWFLTDAFKTGYVIMEKQPIQFILDGVIEFGVDVIILIQLVLYSKDDDAEEGGFEDEVSELEDIQIVKDFDFEEI